MPWERNASENGIAEEIRGNDIKEAGIKEH